MKKANLLIIAIFLTISLTAQVQFTDKSKEILSGEKIRTSLSVSVADLNGDYFDDIATLNNGVDLNLYYNNGALKNYKKDSIAKVFSKAAWTINAGDLDNDGISEIYTCGAQTYGNLYTRRDTDIYTLSQELLGVSYAQNSNMVDINNDGFLDLFVCNENNYNAIYINDKTGKLIWNNYINFKVDENYNNYGDYGSDFIDFDDDGDVDLFITKCWPPAEIDTDPRRINTLFLNDGNNQYTDKASDFGLNSGAQSWTGMFGDMDNDGDLDCFVTNHDTIHYYYENIENDTFIIKTGISFPIVSSQTLQASLRDLDNNGYLDIIISGDISYIIWNNGNDEYTVEEEPFGHGDIHSFAIGDLNSDGFLDIYASYGKGTNEIGNYKDLIWINKTNDNHFAKFSLWGEESNRQGIGAKIKIYGTWGIQTRDARIGESYGITNSLNLNFGLAQWDIIDSLVIKWPSGIVDKYYDIPSDEHYLLQEGIGMNRFFDIENTGNLRFCSGDSVILSAPKENLVYQWSTGATTKDIVVKTTGSYSLTMTNSYGEKFVSKITATELNPVEKPQLTFSKGYFGNCNEDEVILNCDDSFTSYQWFRNDSVIEGGNFPELEIFENGNYFLKAEGICDFFTSDTFAIGFLEVNEPIVEYEDTVHEKKKVTITAQGDIIYWYNEEGAIEPIDTGFTFITDTIESNKIFWVENNMEFEYNSKYVGITDNIDKTDGSSNVNGGLIFDCLKDIILKSVKVYSGQEGVRRFQLKDAGKSVIATKDVMVNTGEQRIELGFEIGVGKDYRLETDKEVNITNLSTKSPNLFRDRNENVQFPYENDLISINESYFGRNYYYYFYDWEIQERGIICTSSRKKIEIIYDPDIATFDLKNISINISPNPTSDFLYIKDSNQFEQGEIIIFNILGEKILKQKFIDNPRINVIDLKQGIYLVKVFENGKQYIGKFIKK